MPGLLLCFVMRYDKYKKQAAVATDTEQSKITYFHCSLIGYIVGKLHHILYSDLKCQIIMKQGPQECPCTSMMKLAQTFSLTNLNGNENCYIWLLKVIPLK